MKTMKKKKLAVIGIAGVAGMLYSATPASAQTFYQCMPITCPAGSYLLNGKCEICPRDSYCVNSQKTACPTGTYSHFGAKSFNDCANGWASWSFNYVHDGENCTIRNNAGGCCFSDVYFNRNEITINATQGHFCQTYGKDGANCATDCVSKVEGSDTLTYDRNTKYLVSISGQTDISNLPISEKLAKIQNCENNPKTCALIIGYDTFCKPGCANEYRYVSSSCNGGGSTCKRANGKLYIYNASVHAQKNL